MAAKTFMIVWAECFQASFAQFMLFWGVSLAAAVLLCSVVRGDVPPADSGTCKNVLSMRFGGHPPHALEDVLPVCGAFSHNTCCNVTNLEPVLLNYRILQAGRVSEKCLAASEVVLCYACHPDVGVGVVKTICPDLCNNWYAACADEYYSPTVDGSLMGCLDSSEVCSPLRLIVSNGEELCKRFDYTVAPQSTRAQSQCYSGKPPPKPARGTTLSSLFSSLDSSLFTGSNSSKLFVSVASWLGWIVGAVITVAVLYPYIRSATNKHKGNDDASRRNAVLAAAEQRRAQQTQSK